MKYGVIASVLALMLAGCGGGGGSSSPVPPAGNGGGTHNATLQAGFAPGGSTTTATRNRIATTIRRESTSLTGALQPFAIFFVPDSYVPATLFSTVGYRAVAYVSGDIPTTLPTVTWSQSPANLQFLGVDANLTDVTPPSGSVVVGIENVGAPSSAGQTIVTASSTTLGESVNITANAYPGFAVGIPAFSGANGTPSGVTFTASGSEATPNGTTPDLSISGDGTTASSFVAPNGIEEFPGQSIDEVTASEWNPANAVTTLVPTSICDTANPDTFLLKTQSGAFVKFEADGIYFSGIQPNGVCAFSQIPAGYQISNGGTFAF